MRALSLLALALLTVLTSSSHAGIITQSGSRHHTQAGGGSVLPEFPYDSTRSVVSGSLYVDPSGAGSDADDCLSLANACATISGAMGKLASSSSKIIYLMNGTHAPGATVTTSGSGTLGNPRQITSYPGHTPVIDCNGLSRCFNVDGTSYWKFSHLTIVDWGGATSLGAIVVSENNTTTGFELYAIDGTTGRCGDNQGLVHYWTQSRAPDTVIDRVRLNFTGDNTETANSCQNTAGLYVNRGTAATTAPATFDHLQINGYPVGIYHKHGEEGRTTLSGATVSNSIFSNNNRINVGHNPAGWLYTNVIFGDSPNPIILAEVDGGPAGDANQYVHCTFYSGLLLANQGDGANNNKLTNSIMRVALTINAGSIVSSSDYNAFTSGSIINGMDLAAWRTANSSDANSVQGTLSFAGGADDSLPSYYALAGGSIGNNAASDGTDMGADVTTVGVQAP